MIYAGTQAKKEPIGNFDIQIYGEKIRDIPVNQQVLRNGGFDDQLRRGLQSFHFFLERAAGLYLCTHENPDADGLGSQIALALGLRKLLIPVTIVNPDDPPEKFRFLDSANELTAVADEFDWFDLQDKGFIILDTNNFSRTTRVYEKVKDQVRRLFIIDHHTCQPELQNHNLITVNCAATGELVYHILQYLNIPLDKEIARAIYTSILSDTGCFRYPNTTPLTHEILADVHCYGIDPYGIYNSIFQNYRPGRVLLMSPALESLRLLMDNQLAVIDISRQQMIEYQVQAEDTDNIVNLALSYQGVLGSLMFREEADGKIKVSMRSLGNVDVASIAHIFEGGGHKNAAGTKLSRLSDKEKLINAFCREIESKADDQHSDF